MAKRSGLAITDGSNVFYTDDILSVVADNATFNPQGEDGSNDYSDGGKHVCGCDLGYIFSPFSAKDANTGGYAEILSSDEVAALEDGPSSLHAVYQTKFMINESFIISDKNLPDDRTRGTYSDIENGDHQYSSIRGFCLNAPMYVSGFGIRSSGQAFYKERVGPLDIVWNDNSKMWQARQQFPAPARIKSVQEPEEASDEKYLYTVELIGAIRDGDSGHTDDNGAPWDMKLAASGNVCIAGDDRYEIEDVFCLNNYRLAVGDFVTVFYNSSRDTLSCIKNDKRYFLCRNDSGEEIPEKSVAKIVANDYLFGDDSDAENIIEGPVYAVEKPDEDGLTNIVIVPYAIAIDEYGLCLSPDDSETIAKVTLDGTVEEETEVGTVGGQWYLSSDAGGYYVTSQKDGVGYIRPVGGGGVYLYEATSNQVGNTITARKLNSDGTLSGLEETFYVLPD
jgi:hypothetical protein